MKMLFLRAAVAGWMTTCWAANLFASTTYDLANQTDFDAFNPAVLVPGDVVRLARGVVFYGQLDIGTSNITITAYGSGDDPVISGEQVLSGWIACTSGCPAGNTWYATLSQSPNSVFVNGSLATLARYPDSGYRTVTSATSSSLTDNTLTYNPGWTGASIHVRTSNWTWENRNVTSYNSGSKTFGFSPTNYTTEAGFAYFLDNKLTELDADNEWYYATSTFRLYLKLPSDPSGYTVTASVHEYGIQCNDNLSGISISNIEFRRQKRHGVQMAGTSAANNSIQNCTFDGQYEIGTNLSGSNVTVSGNTFRNQNGRALHAEGLENSTISGNDLQDIGQVPGYGTSGDAGLAGLVVYSGSSNTIASNTIDNIGYIGIIMDGDNSTCEYNIVSNCMTKTSDGAGIKCFGTLSHHNVIRRNIVSACNGDPTTTPYTNFLTSAIYLDFYCHDNRIDSNIIFDQPKAGIQINKDNTYDTIRGNVVFGSKAGIMFLSGLTSGDQIENCHVRRNVFYTLDEDGTSVLIANMGATGLPGSLDSNFYCNPYGTTVVTRRLNLTNYLYYTLSDWQGNSGEDAHTLGSYQTWTYPENYAELYQNASSSPLAVNLGGGYVDLNNVPISTFTLPAFFGKLVVEELALPVEWLNPFRATVQGNDVRLDWSTAAEENVAGFAIERSADTRNFEEIGEVKGVNGSGAYAFMDEQPLPGTNYYRLRQMDHDGRSEYSPTVSVEVGREVDGISLFPNPASGTVTLALETHYIGEAKLTFYDLMGRQAKTQVLSLEGSPLLTGIDLSGLSGGVYLAEIKAGNERWQERLVVE